MLDVLRCLCGNLVSGDKQEFAAVEQSAAGLWQAVLLSDSFCGG
jgi:hypothetical protein